MNYPPQYGAPPNGPPMGAAPAPYGAPQYGPPMGAAPWAPPGAAPAPYGAPQYGPGGFGAPATFGADFYGQIGGITPNGAKGDYLPGPGRFVVALEKAQLIQTREKGPAQIVEMRLLSAAFPAGGDAPPPVMVGGLYSYFRGLGPSEASDLRRMGLGDISAFLVALCGLNWSDPAAQAAIAPCMSQLWQGINSARNPLAGVVMSVETKITWSKAKGAKPSTPWTNHIWSVGPADMGGRAMPVDEILTGTGRAAPVVPAAGPAPAPWAPGGAGGVQLSAPGVAHGAAGPALRGPFGEPPLYSPDGQYVSTDGGASWHPVAR